MIDAISFSPARVGTTVRIDLDVTKHETLWYQKQYRDEKQNYVVWRRIDPPVDDCESSREEDIIGDMMGYKRKASRITHWVESNGDIERQIDLIQRARPGIVIERVWKDEI